MKRQTLFPMPRNRKQQPTDENELLHAICIAIRDGSAHAKLRKLIGHLPKIMNRLTPYNATEKRNFELQERINALEAELRRERNKKLTDVKPGPELPPITG